MISYCRPISNLLISKKMEKVMYTQMNNDLSQNNMYDLYQLGFRNNHSTETALTRSFPHRCVTVPVSIAILGSLFYVRAVLTLLLPHLLCAMPRRWTAPATFSLASPFIYISLTCKSTYLAAPAPSSSRLSLDPLQCRCSSLRLLPLSSLLKRSSPLPGSCPALSHPAPAPALSPRRSWLSPLCLWFPASLNLPMETSRPAPVLFSRRISPHLSYPSALHPTPPSIFTLPSPLTQRAFPTLFKLPLVKTQ